MVVCTSEVVWPGAWCLRRGSTSRNFSHYIVSYMYSAILLIVFMSSRWPHTILSRGRIRGEILPGIGACIMNSAYEVAIKQAVHMARYATKPLLRRCSGTYLGTLGWWIYVLYQSSGRWLPPTVVQICFSMNHPPNRTLPTASSTARDLNHFSPLSTLHTLSLLSTSAIFLAARLLRIPPFFCFSCLSLSSNFFVLPSTLLYCHFLIPSVSLIDWTFDSLTDWPADERTDPVGLPRLL